MRETIFRRILRYLTLWFVLFLLLCVVSVVKYWNIFVGILSDRFYSLAGGIVVVLCIIGGIFYILRNIFR